MVIIVFVYSYGKDIPLASPLQMGFWTRCRHTTATTIDTPCALFVIRWSVRYLLLVAYFITFVWYCKDAYKE